MPTCITCVLSQHRDAGDAQPWDDIHATTHWQVVHAMAASLEGWLILIPKRHVTAIADLTAAEMAEFGPLLHATSAALTHVLSCTKTYVAQFAEHSDHPHVHFHVIARPADLGRAYIGPGIFALLNTPGAEQVTEVRKNELALQLRERLHASSNAGIIDR